ncbi:M20/M25/M40 family metallo-hydrolase [Streptomyces phaeochromogenes]|uniref:M20/M25/M40 family metallo-hydrolase n=1 Tax=Streptomyces phaeochromogenes TaxID=1923 RepID=UPI0033C44792
MIDERRLLDDLARFVAIPSVSADPAMATDVHRCAAVVAEAFRDVGIDATTVTAAGGLPAVVGRAEGPPGAPTVLLYAHYDVQPVGDLAAWQSDPFTLTPREGRLFGRGAADDKGGIAVHLETLRALGPDLPVSVAVLIEGEEEIGSPTLAALLAEHADLLRADLVLAPDAVNAGPLAPTLTVSLRGLLNVLVTVRTAERPVHSGIYGGAVPDALSALVRLLAALTDEHGAVAIEGLHRRTGSTGGPDAGAVRAEAGMLPGVHLVGHGSMAERLWDGPALTITGIDAPSAMGAANVLPPIARAAISIRLAPEDDPGDILSALKIRLAAYAPWGVHLDVEPVAMGRGWRAGSASPHMTLARQVLQTAFGTPVTTVGVGGAIPFVATVLDAMPEADILVTAVQDPLTQAHAPDGSVAQATLAAATRAETEMLRRLR